MNRIEIPVSKRKLIFSFIGSVTFVFAGCLFIIAPSSFAGKTVIHSDSMIITVGVLSILFFGLCGFFLAKKLFTKTPGLVIDDKGISDYSGGIEGGSIPWRDISDIGTTKVLRQQLVTVLLKEPQTYIDRESNSAKRKIMQANLRAVGTPYCISANTLAIGFKALHRLLKEQHKKNTGSLVSDRV